MAESGSEGFETLDGIGGDIDVWDKRTLKEKLGDVSDGGVFRGKDFIYPLWKTLLNKWLAYKTSKVYLVTPFLDEQRMQEVCRIALLNEADDRIASFYVREKCNFSKSISDLQETVTGEIKSDDKSKKMQTRLESIYEKIVDPGKTFHAKFMCCVRGSKAEVFITSANFHGSHFDCNNLDTVQYITTTKKNFEERFLQPLT
ncbi:uncharacterized protein LOC132755341 [Ruditapes philippinarum]|uniref:uncharacterized protein LOC132755341 n=1 Tax=Ruditapes philippinarum TaxID=129788 RepID=UPI00295B2E8C|nr:uncharacterized protein LOC132755341 [Ruditapes philippinarum]